MNSNGQRLLNHRSTAGAFLRSVARLNQYDHPTSILSFVRSVLYQLSPGCIRNAFCLAMILKHMLDPQIFKSHPAKSVYQLAAFLMSDVFPPICNALMNVLDCLTAFCTFGCTYLESLRWAFASSFSSLRKKRG
jgi:hypothetical protein